MSDFLVAGDENALVACVGIEHFGDMALLRSLCVTAQLSGAVLGTWLAHAMFALPIVQLSTKVRPGPGQWLAETVATFGLLVAILKAPGQRVAGLVAAWIGAAYWFTASASFANPAAVFGRMLSDSFAGIAPPKRPRVRDRGARRRVPRRAARTSAPNPLAEGARCREST